MLPFTNMEKADMHFIYGTANGNGSEAQRLYGERFPDRLLPDRKAFERLHRKLCVTGSFLASRSDAGRARTDGALVVEEDILDVVDDQSSTSARAVARQLHVSHSTTRRVLKDERLHSYPVQRVQELTQRDYPRRVEFALWFLKKSAVNPDFGATMLFTDECAFTREGVFNTNNHHVWADVNPLATYSYAHQ
ncbi:hypothetical protein AVEN_174043-1 [Araneus ventricosus]|uniref:DUF4817 domain-containing protein n=1 Tax=Araneus ventricosus TaxID=182803 RepID=A0A4Y2C1F9_ARAVE|nr:hypothetical protein AVEN_174043-1 [Araneus ventricosus]